MAVANTLAYYYEAIITVVKGATTFSITTFNLPTLSITKFSLTTLSIKSLFVTLTINDMQQN